MNSYQIGGYSLSRVESIRDLGIYFDSKLLFDVHVESVVNKAYRMLGFILRVGKDFRKE